MCADSLTSHSSKQRSTSASRSRKVRKLSAILGESPIVRSVAFVSDAQQTLPFFFTCDVLTSRAGFGKTSTIRNKVTRARFGFSGRRGIMCICYGIISKAFREAVHPGDDGKW